MAATRKNAYDNIAKKRLPVIVRGVRTPFLNSGGAYSDFYDYELAALPLKCILEKTGVAAKQVEIVTMGMVVQDVETTNVAREAMLTAGYPSTIPAYTISMAGVSPAMGVMNVCDMIALGRIDIAVAGGSENFSDLPIRMARNVRKRAVKLATAKSTGQKLKILAGLRPKDIIPELPSGVDLTTNMNMGTACEAMVQRFGVTRAQADAYAARSHQSAGAAWQAGHYDDDVMSVTNNSGSTVTCDDSMRPDTTEEKLAKLTPSFDKKNGVITAGNASGLTDGSAALLLMSSEAARQHQLTPMAIVRDYQITGVTDMHTEMLLGPTMSIPRLLARNGLSMDDIDVFELHEAFAAQILANQQALSDDKFAQTELGLDKACGPIPIEKLNPWGGSVALGNPFAATGGRILATAARRLQAEQARYAVVSTCAGGGLGAAMLLENAEFS